MGCVFSRNDALSFRKKKKKLKIPQGNERLLTSSYGVHPIEKPLESRPIPSKGAQNISFIYENILQEYSLLGFLMGGKNFADEELVFTKPTLKAIPEVLPDDNVPTACSSQEAIHESPKTIRTIPTTVQLPDCLIYRGLHEWGFHLFLLDSEKYCRSPEITDHIPDAISGVVGGRWFMVVYRQQQGHTAYLPHQLGHAGRLFNTLCTRFGLQLLRIIFFNPSWYVQVRLEEQRRTGEKLFSDVAMNNIKFLQKPSQLAKWTGFPGNIKVPKDFI